MIRRVVEKTLMGRKSTENIKGEYRVEGGTEEEAKLKWTHKSNGWGKIDQDSKGDKSLLVRKIRDISREKCSNNVTVVQVRDRDEEKTDNCPYKKEEKVINNSNSYIIYYFNLIHYNNSQKHMQYQFES